MLPASLKRSRSGSIELHDGTCTPSRKRSTSQEISTGADVEMTEQGSQQALDALNLAPDTNGHMQYDATTAVQAGSVQTSTTPSGQEQLDQIRQLKSKALVKGDTWYIIARSWYRQWEVACSTAQDVATEDFDNETLFSMQEIGPIDNTPLLDADGKLKEVPQEGANAVFLPKEAWLLLLQWYGLKSAPIERNVVGLGSASGSERIEFFPPVVRLRKVVAPVAPLSTVPIPTFQMSQGDTLGQLRQHARAAFPDIPATSELRFYRLPLDHDVMADGQQNQPADRTGLIFAHHVPADVERCATGPDNQNLLEAQLDDRSLELAVDYQQPDGSFLIQSDEDASNAVAPSIGPQAMPAGFTFGNGKGFFDTLPAGVNHLQAKKTSSKERQLDIKPFTQSTSSSTRSNMRSLSKTKGVVGLQNLGNTCFMNSALQCLSNCPELRRYFESPAWKDEINTDNPLGMSGAVAEAFGDLIKSMWSTSNSSVTPRNFKTMIGRFRPMFIGWSQQDTQELLSFLLDGLHEDLNRILKKPATVKPEWQGGGDLEMMAMAQESWKLFRMRNDSVIVDLFQGMYRSTVVCPDCSKVSITFDAFTSLTLPMPPKAWSGWVFVVPLDPKQPRIKMAASLPGDASIKTLKKYVSDKLGMTGSSFVAAEVFSHKFYRGVPDDDTVSSISAAIQQNTSQPRDLVYLYEVPFEWDQSNCSVSRSKSQFSDVVKDSKRGLAVVPVLLKTGSNWAGLPFVFGIRAEEASSYEAVYEALVWQIARQTSAGADMFDYDQEAMTDEAQHVSTRPLANLAGVPADAKPLPNLFTIYVNAHEDNVGNVPYKEDVLRVANMKLQDRAAQGRSAQPRTGPNRLPGSFNTAEEEDAELKALYDGAAASAGQPVPIIQSGDVLVCHFNAAAAQQFFNDQVQMHDWKAVEIFQETEQTRGHGASPELTLDACLTEFSKQEQLDAQNTWYCPACKEHKQATKQVDLWSLPDILVIHLKRFSASRWGTRDKITDTVDFPIEGLDLTDRVVERQLGTKLVQTEKGRQLLGVNQIDSEPVVYDLFAVDNHFGGLGGGHYTAYAKNSEDGKWYNFDDSFASPVGDPEKTVKTSAAYLLFYRRRTRRPVGSLHSQKTVEIVASAVQSAANSDAEDDPVVTADGSASASISDLKAAADEPAPFHDASRWRNIHPPSSVIDSEPSMSESRVSFSDTEDSSSNAALPDLSDHDFDLKDDLGDWNVSDDEPRGGRLPPGWVRLDRDASVPVRLDASWDDADHGDLLPMDQRMDQEEDEFEQVEPIEYKFA